jgi:hypothetical protein
MPVQARRRRAEARLGNEMLEEPGEAAHEGVWAVPPTAWLEPGDDDLEQLLDRAAHLLG